MTPAERAAKIAELRAEADRLEREGKRVKLKEGQVWRRTNTGNLYLSHLAHDSDDSEKCRLTCWNDGFRWSPAPWFNGKDDEFEYVGLARDLLTIKMPDAPEPTGAELVGEVCEFADYPGDWEEMAICTNFSKPMAKPYASEKGRTFRFARLAKEQP